MNAYQQIMIIARPDRKRENLQVLLKANPRAIEVLCVNTFAEASDQLKMGERYLVIIDHQFPLAELKDGIENIRRKNPNMLVALMLSHPLQQDQYAGIPADLCVYENFSMDDLQRLMVSHDTGALYAAQS